MEYASGWRSVATWPTSDESAWLGIPDGCLSQVRNAYISGFRIERLTRSARSHASECRIACRSGELFPYSAGWWAWNGPGGLYARRVLDAIASSTGTPRAELPQPGERYEECVIVFPDDCLVAVSVAVKAKRRRRQWHGYLDSHPGTQLKNLCA